MSLAFALRHAGHEPVAVTARSEKAGTLAAQRLGTRLVAGEEPLPSADVVVLAVRDDAIEEVADDLATRAGRVRYAVHLSGLKPVDCLAGLAAAGLRVGAFHPLQTLPNPEDGSAALPGAWVAVTAADAGLHSLLEDLAYSIGARPFDLADSHRDLYHAAAAASSNYLVAALALAEELYRRADVPFEVSRPLAETVVDNAFRLGPLAALTGPVARGDVGTVQGQLAAVARWAPDMVDDYRAFARATARIAGTETTFEGIL
jgi:predicted short-subunit dehydrogenase-like oxidoreductase (DUF2520 family)